MKKKLVILASIMTIMVVTIYTIYLSLNRSNKDGEENEEGNIRVVTSFYPVYVLTLNLTDQIPGLKVDSLTDFSAGCLHDYQLTTNDMRLLSNADVFIINGGGMEEYLEDVINSHPDMTVIDISQGISMLEGIEHAHNHEHGEHEEDRHDEEDGHDENHDHVHENNPHVWLDPDLYMMQIENASQGLKKYILDLGLEGSTTDNIINQLESNTRAYITKVQEIADQMNIILDTVKDMVTNRSISNKVVIFHDSFAYLANKAGLEIAYAVEIDEDTPLSAGEVAEVISVIREDNIKYLFTEKQHDGTIADRIMEETEAEIYIIDSAVTGDGTKDSYLEAMKSNINILKTAFK